MNIEEDYLKSAEELITIALKEDLGSGDVTTDSIIPTDEKAKAYLLAKSDGIIAGMQVAEMVFRRLDEALIWNPKVSDGASVNSGTELVEFEGSFKALLSAERTALNFLQRMSGIATTTNKFVKAIEGTKTKILDTRKTLPGFRLLDKYSVKMGGGTNHRIGLYDLVMIKDNHIKIAGGISQAVEAVREKIANKFNIEVETKNLEEVKEAINSYADIIMLDNMSVDTMKEAVKLINGMAAVEASGSINLENVKQVAETGVDFISVGAITHSVNAFDISQYIL